MDIKKILNSLDKSWERDNILSNIKKGISTDDIVNDFLAKNEKWFLAKNEKLILAKTKNCFCAKIAIRFVPTTRNNNSNKSQVEKRKAVTNQTKENTTFTVKTRQSRTSSQRASSERCNSKVACNGP